MIMILSALAAWRTMAKAHISQPTSASQDALHKETRRALCGTTFSQSLRQVFSAAAENDAIQLHPLVAPQFSHLWQAPFLTMI